MFPIIFISLKVADFIKLEVSISTNRKAYQIFVMAEFFHAENEPKPNFGPFSSFNKKGKRKRNSSQ